MVERGLYIPAPEMGLWKGPDIATAQSVVVNHFERVPVMITKESIGPYPYYPYRALWSVRNFVYGDPPYIYPSVRSRYAQVGLNIDNRLVNQIGEWLQYNTHLDEKGDVPNSIIPVITVENHSSRPVILDKGAHLFRFFKENYTSHLQDYELVEAVKSGLIKIQGERLGDWTYSYGQVAGRKLPRPVGIFIRVNPENRGWIPPHSENKQIYIPDLGEGYRKTVDSLLEPIPGERIKKILWIGETIKVTLAQSVDAVLDTVALRDIRTDKDFTDAKTWGIQLNSRIIDGGRTDWPVRVEIISSTSPDEIPNFVHLHFVKNGH